tara:strand:+ start:376 stop:519 length:144 start_codon:yes stop_codon:yes gene_type:complete
MKNLFMVMILAAVSIPASADVVCSKNGYTQVFSGMICPVTWSFVDYL